MNISTPQQAIELLHLLFILQFNRTVDKQTFVLKGGCNLRFFMKSIRYSQDIDFDIQTIAKATLEKNVDKILTSPSFLKTLQINKIELLQVSKPKQTETTQRWKISLKNANSNLAIPTKIEFSRRGITQPYVLSQVDVEVIRQYNLLPITINHYTAEDALVQKIIALAERTETQCRDVFDLNLLITQADNINEKLIDKNIIHKAIDNCLGLHFSDYIGQVVAYLEYDYQKEYGSKEMWEVLQMNVISFLEQWL